MITTVREDRMVVVSDVHLGNPLYRSRRRFQDFLRYACEREFSVCINGDGIDIMQSSLESLSRDLTSCNRQFTQFAERGLRIYYTVGNHDIVLEQFLDDWGVVRVAPFLNVLSGDRRIRLEHGHIYDEMFVRYPRTYCVMTQLGALMLRISPRVFQSTLIVNNALIGLGELWNRREPDQAELLARTIPGQRADYVRAALEISARGFDAVVFGHTHRQGEIELPGGARYYNTGHWEVDPYYLEIDHGTVTLRPVSAAPR